MQSGMPGNDTKSRRVGDARSSASVVEPDDVHTRAPVRPSISVAPLPVGTSTRCEAAMYAVQNSTFCWRSQVTVKLFTTRST